MTLPFNEDVARKLVEVADILEQQKANPFRVSAYRRAADTVAGLPEDLRDIVATKGHDGLIAIPTIGRGIANAIWEMAATGRWSQLERLRGGLDPLQLFCTVPGIGPDLAQRIHDALHVDTLEALETAAYDGRLDQVPGIGARRLAGIRASLSTMLGRRRAPTWRTDGHGPDVATLLEVDDEYRTKADADTLPRIAPKRFNPEREAWLPVLHTDRRGWHFTVLYSNTSRAHELGKTRDWVVIYFYDDHHEEGQHTVVTETRGPLSGRRVVRGREQECRAHYRQSA